MAMSSYEVVRRAIEFGGPDRLPVRFAALEVDDTHSVGGFFGTGDPALRESIDKWGCVWNRTEMANMGQVKGHPLSEWSALDHYRWPDPDNPALYEEMEAKFAGSEGKYVTTYLFMLLFERMHTLRGFQNTLTDLYLERERIEALADRIIDVDLAIIQNTNQRFPGLIDGFSFTDDWGTQKNAFIRPQLWDEFFKPRYERVITACHEIGWHVWMHTCGKVNDIIESLIDIGLDVINLQQPRALGIEEIGRRYRGRICFESLCDIQHTLPFKGAKEIRGEAGLLLEEWATPDGGFILSDYGGNEAIGVEAGKGRIMLDAFLEADPWKART